MQYFPSIHEYALLRYAICKNTNVKLHNLCFHQALRNLLYEGWRYKSIDEHYGISLVHRNSCKFILFIFLYCCDILESHF